MRAKAGKGIPPVSSRIAIVTHVFASGTAQALDQYLTRCKRTHVFIGHPFLRASREASYCVEVGPDGGTRLLATVLPAVGEPLRYFFDFLSSVWWLIRFGPFDTVVGCGVSNAFAGLAGRALGRVHRVVLYSIDYTPIRFQQPLLNMVFRTIERVCVRHCDWVWNLSAEMAFRRDRGWLRLGHGARQVIVPHGAGFDIAARPQSKKEPATIAFVGHLLEKQGVQHVLSAMPTILQKVPEARFVVMGTGPYEVHLKSQARQLGLEDHVEFTGYVADYGAIQGRLGTATLGVAPYVRELATFTQFADPGKIKDYIAAALPVIMTSVPPISAVVAARGAGEVVEGTPGSIADAIIRFLLDHDLRDQASTAARRMAESYDWSTIFSAALSSSIDAPSSDGGASPPDTKS